MENHKHYGQILAWANGHQIQVLLGQQWVDIDQPVWEVDCEYRIKPEYVSEDFYICFGWDTLQVTSSTDNPNYRVTYEKHSQEVVSIERIVRDEQEN